MEIIKLGLERKDSFINLLLIVSVDSWSREDSDPGQGEDGETVHDGSNVCQQVHGNSELEKIKQFYNFCMN